MTEPQTARTGKGRRMKASFYVSSGDSDIPPVLAQVKGLAAMFEGDAAEESQGLFAIWIPWTDAADGDALVAICGVMGWNAEQAPRDPED